VKCWNTSINAKTRTLNKSILLLSSRQSSNLNHLSAEGAPSNNFRAGLRTSLLANRSQTFLRRITINIKIKRKPTRATRTTITNKQSTKALSRMSLPIARALKRRPYKPVPSFCNPNRAHQTYNSSRTSLFLTTLARNSRQTKESTRSQLRVPQESFWDPAHA
jgi:hypothetical protein